MSRAELFERIHRRVGDAVDPFFDSMERLTEGRGGKLLRPPVVAGLLLALPAWLAFAWIVNRLRKP